MSAKKDKVERHPWRENLEAIAMAVIVALLFKYFILEISKIPSGSMQPTLMGEPQVQVFDRVLVDKLSFHLRDPERWEIVVFKHPLERSRIMVKRLVGLPGEELKVENGDLWTRPDDRAPWKILRKPRAVQEEMWRKLDVDDPERPSWKALDGASNIRVQGRDISFLGPGSVRFRPEDYRIVDGYLDGYPDSLRDEIRVANHSVNAVGDLRVEGNVRAGEQTASVTFVLTEALRTYRLELPGPAAARGARPTISVRDAGGAARATNGGSRELDQLVSAEEPYALPAGSSVTVAAENVDDRLSLQVDGDEVLSLDIEPTDAQEATVVISVEGADAEIEDLHVYRDIYYLPHTNGTSWTASIPEGQYVMLGDNTQNSADSRDWKSVVYEWTDPDGKPRSEKGNLYPAEPDENPSEVYLDDGRPGIRFRDEWGEKNWFAERDGSRIGTPRPFKTVPRHLIQGRAVAVFWPIKPHRGLWRLTWLH